jgi:hypothetical protein
VLDGHVGSNGAIVKWALRRETRKPQEDTQPSLAEDL